MIYIVNIFTVLLAIVFAVQLSSENKAYLYSALAIVFGFSLHIYEAFQNRSMGICEFSDTVGFLVNIDRCIDYESGTMLYAQAAILAGFTVIFIKLASKSNPNK